jgi:NADH-quinone oxidoreductase subunit N
MFFVLFFLSIFFLFFVLVFSSFFSFNYSRTLFKSLYSLIFFFIFIFCHFFTTYFYPISNSLLVGLNNWTTTFLFSTFIFALHLFFIVIFFTGRFNFFGFQNLSSFFFYYVSVVFSIFLAHADDFILFVSFSELIAIPTYLLFFFTNKTPSILSSFKYLIINSLGTLFICFSFLFAFYYFGVSCFSDLFLIFQYPQIWIHDFEVGYYFFQFFFWIGIIVKFGLFPFHFWVPDIYQNISKFGLVLLAIFSKLPFMPVLFEVGRTLVLSSYIEWFGYFLLLSIFYSSIRAFFDAFSNKLTFRKMIAYSSINNLAIIFFLSFSSNFYTFFYFNFFYFLSSFLVFITYFDIALSTPFRELPSFSYIYKNSDSPVGVSYVYQSYKSSIFLFFFAIFLLSGLPPFGFFFAKFLGFSAIFSFNFFFNYIFFGLSFILSSFVFIYAYFKFTYYLFFLSPFEFTNFFISLNKKPFSFKDYIRVFAFFILFSTTAMALFIYYFIILCLVFLLKFKPPVLIFQLFPIFSIINIFLNPVFRNRVILLNLEHTCLVVVIGRKAYACIAAVDIIFPLQLAFEAVPLVAITDCQRIILT